MNSVDLAKEMRKHVLRMVHSARSSHIGSCYSAIDILSVLYTSILRYNANHPGWPERDRLILSKGHAAAAVYAVLAEKGFFPKDWLATYGKNGTKLQGHLSHGVPGVEISTGSLGHGLPIGNGMALAAKQGNKDYRVYVIMSDGECDEGSVWEAALFAAQHQLDNLTVIVDYNKIQGFGRVKEVLNLEPFADKWKAFGWNILECDGHHHEILTDLLSSLSFKKNAPNVMIAHTVKGKGISFMEDQLMWHYRSPDEENFSQAMQELETIIQEKVEIA